MGTQGTHKQLNVSAIAEIEVVPHELIYCKVDFSEYLNQQIAFKMKIRSDNPPNKPPQEADLKIFLSCLVKEPNGEDCHHTISNVTYHKKTKSCVETLIHL